ncbi:MAG TPA: hypothetical protein VEA69_13375 [Tepidisphaeraceae bacterium]|nr:hypothetical protein [Tepidisphaeraceae bacterium]
MVVSAFILIALLFVQRERNAIKEREAFTPSRPPAPPVRWERVKLPMMNASAELPGPVETERKDAQLAGLTLTIHAISGYDRGLMCVFGHIEFPPDVPLASPEETARIAPEWMRAMSGATVVSSYPITWRGRPAVEIIARLDNLQCTARITVVGRRAVTAHAASRVLANYGAEMRRFFESVEIE